MMKMPELIDYGMTKEIYETTTLKVKKLKNYLELLYIVFTIIISLTLTIIISNDHKLEIGYYFGKLIIAFGILFFIILFTNKIVSRFIEYILIFNLQYRKIKEYDLAIQKYNDWWERTKREFWLSLNGISFEYELAKLFNNIGYLSEVTKASGDECIDIKLRDEHNRLIIVQCKAHKSPVGPAAVRELYGALKHSGANEAILASLSGFTTGVFDFIKNKPIKLISLNEILDVQKKLE